jgi:hypothetical protein
MQSFLEVLAPLIMVCVFGVILLAWAGVVGVSRMRLWNALRVEAETRAHDLREKEAEFVFMANDNRDAVMMMISEMAEHPAMYETMPPWLTEQLHNAYRRSRLHTANLRSDALPPSRERHT